LFCPKLRSIILGIVAKLEPNFKVFQDFYEIEEYDYMMIIVIKKLDCCKIFVNMDR